MMTGRIGPLAPVSLVLASVILALSAGCAGVGALSEERLGPTELAGAVAAEPDIAAPVGRALPGLIQSIHANGVVWVGANVVTAQAGKLDEYDGGEGGTFGLAFGNGEDIKRFLEVVYVETKHHEHRDTNGVIDGDIDQSHFYIGGRWYLLPVTGARARGAPFFVGGVCWNNMVNSGGDALNPYTTGDQDLDLRSIYGLGVYLGSGIEIYLGTQLALCLDVRASFWNWEGVPGNTGYQTNAGGSVSLAYHF